MRPLFAPSSKASRSGFSFVEMLIVVVVVGIMAAVAIAQLGAQRKVFQDTRNRRNAQELMSMCQSAKAAGIVFAATNDPVQTARNAAAGATAAKGIFAGKTFKLPGLTDDEVVEAAYYLDVSGEEVTYNAARVPPP